MNIHTIHEQNHGKFYNSIIWLKRQVLQELRVTNLSCPKEAKIMYTNKPLKIRVLGVSFKIKGLFQLPKIISVLTDKFEDDIVKVNTSSDKLNQHMFKHGVNYFKNKNAKSARKVLCSNCIFVHCEYKR